MKNNKRDNIYIYLWEEFNTVYVGRTVNPKSRHYQHRHVPTETTYKFSSEHHVEHPKMIIIENDLSVEEGAEREKYWINEYRDNSPYRVLNKTRGGEIGKISELTEEEKIERRNKWAREYYSNHKESELLRQKKYRKKIDRTSYFKSYNITHKNDRKNYGAKNRKRLNEYMKKYREKNKEKINARRREIRKIKPNKGLQ